MLPITFVLWFCQLLSISCYGSTILNMHEIRCYLISLKSTQIQNCHSSPVYSTSIDPITVIALVRSLGNCMPHDYRINSWHMGILQIFIIQTFTAHMAISGGARLWSMMCWAWSKLLSSLLNSSQSFCSICPCTKPNFLPLWLTSKAIGSVLNFSMISRWIW